MDLFSNLATGFGVAATCAGWAIGVLLGRGTPGPGAVAVFAAMLATLLACAAMLTSTLGSGGPTVPMQAVERLREAAIRTAATRSG